MRKNGISWWTHFAFCSESDATAWHSYTVGVDRLHVDLVVGVALQVLQNVRTLHLWNSFVVVVVSGDTPVVDVVVQYRISESLGRRPMNNSELGFDVSDVHLSGSAREYSIPLEETISVLPHVPKTLEIVEVDTGDISCAQLLTQLRQPSSFAARRVVKPICQTAESIRGPRGANHQIGNLRSIGQSWIAQLVHASLVSDPLPGAAALDIRELWSFSHFRRFHISRSQSQGSHAVARQTGSVGVDSCHRNLVHRERVEVVQGRTVLRRWDLDLDGVGGDGRLGCGDALEQVLVEGPQRRHVDGVVGDALGVGHRE